MRVCLYMRYSSDKQSEQSIEGQNRICTDYCDRNGYEIIERYIDRATSAYSSAEKRHDFQRMIRDAEKKGFEAVIVYKLDRFARNRYDSATYKAKLKKSGVRVISATENISDNPEGIILESVLEGMAEFYSKELSQKVSRGMRESALKHKSVGGQIPLGFKIVNKELVLDDNAASIVKEAFDRYASGETMIDIIDSFNERGLKTSKGKAFNKSSFNAMLRNEKYRGVYKYGDIYDEDSLPRIVSDETFQNVQDRLKENRNTTVRHRSSSPYMLTGKLFCGSCGSPMVGDSGRSKSGEVYNYYSCHDRKYGNGCKKKPVRKDVIENIVFKNAYNILTEENIEMIADKTMEYADNENRSNSDIQIVEQSIKSIDTKIGNLMTSIELGCAPASIVQRIGELEEEKRTLHERMEQLQRNTIHINRDQIIFFLYKMSQGDIDDNKFKSKLINLLIDSVVVYDEDPDGSGKIKIVTKYNIVPGETHDTESDCVRIKEDLVHHSGIIRTQTGRFVYYTVTTHQIG